MEKVGQWVLHIHFFIALFQRGQDIVNLGCCRYRQDSHLPHHPSIIPLPIPWYWNLKCVYLHKWREMSYLVKFQFLIKQLHDNVRKKGDKTSVTLMSRPIFFNTVALHFETSITFSIYSHNICFYCIVALITILAWLAPVWKCVTGCEIIQFWPGHAYY